jgi:predicted DNA-binding transcriptional regulator AlpA
MSNETSNHLSPPELAKRLGLTVRTLVNWRRDKKGPKHVKFGSRIIRYRLVDVEAWESEMSATPPPSRVAANQKDKVTGKFLKKD